MSDHFQEVKIPQVKTLPLNATVVVSIEGQEDFVAFVPLETTGQSGVLEALGQANDAASYMQREPRQMDSLLRKVYQPFS